MATTEMEHSIVNKFFNIFLNILIAPTDAIGQIISRRRLSVFPLLLLMLSFVVLWSYYYFNVDIEWLKAKMIADAMQSNPGVDRKIMEEQFSPLSANVLLSITLVTGLITIFFITAIRTLYLHLASKMVGHTDSRLGDWLAITLWSTVPLSLSTLSSYLVFEPEQLSHLAQHELSLTSLNSLLFNVPLSSPWAMLLSSMDITLIWSVLIVCFAFAKLCDMSFAKAVAITFLPFIVLYGIWVMFIVLRG